MNIKLPARAAARYTDLRLIAQGGMGVVLSARDLKTGYDVAIKVVHPEHRDDREVLKRFAREVVALKQLDHPNVVHLLDAFIRKGQAFIVMEYVNGHPLSELLEKGHIEARRAVKLALQAASGVAAAHAIGMVHRDIKPSNVLVIGEDTAKLLDFGLARIMNRNTLTRLTQTGHFVGTIRYVPPEVFAGEDADERSDVFQLGLLLYQMLTGAHPFAKGDLIAFLSGSIFDGPAPPSTLVQGIDKALNGLVLKAMARDPAKRFPHAGTLAMALGSWMKKSNMR